MDLEHITRQVIDLCIKTGAYISEQALLFATSDIEEKGKKNLVTYVDRTAEKMLTEGLAGLVLDADFLGEEFHYERLGHGPVWVIDPLDGTTNFVHGLPIYSISVGLMAKDRPVCGVVYHVPMNECFYAWQGGGAFLNGKAIRVSSRDGLEDSLLVTGFPYRHEGKLERYLEIFREITERSHGLRRLGSAAIDLCYVAAGRMEGFYEYGLNAWDVAAGAIILLEAGGKATDFNGGGNYIYGQELIATNGLIHNELEEIIFRHFYEKHDF